MADRKENPTTLYELAGLMYNLYSSISTIPNIYSEISYFRQKKNLQKCALPPIFALDLLENRDV